MWLNICQGLMLLGWCWRLLNGLARAINGNQKTEPSGALGICFVAIWSALSALVIWRSGAVSTILGAP